MEAVKQNCGLLHFWQSAFLLNITDLFMLAPVRCYFAKLLRTQNYITMLPTQPKSTVVHVYSVVMQASSWTARQQSCEQW